MSKKTHNCLNCNSTGSISVQIELNETNTGIVIKVSKCGCCGQYHALDDNGKLIKYEIENSSHEQFQKILNKIKEVSELPVNKKQTTKVIVMHPTTMEAVKEHITHYHNIPANLHGFMFDNRWPVYMSNRLPKYHFTFMTQSQYDQFLLEEEFPKSHSNY